MEWKLAFAEFAAANPGIGAPIADIAYLPPDWQRAVQYSASHVLTYTAGSVWCAPAPVGQPAPPGLFFEDSDFVDVGPWLEEYSSQYGVPIHGLIGLIHAECGFDADAVRRGVWPDVSGGYSQMTIQTAAGYGIGDGSPSIANVEAVLAVLVDRETGISLAARHYQMCLTAVDQSVPGIEGDGRLVLGLRAYNGGVGYGLSPDYATRYAGHIAAYQQAINLAKQVLHNKGYPGY